VGDARAEEDDAPRMVFIFVPNGMHMPAWTPATTGRDYALTAILDPFAPVRDDLTIVSGMNLTAAEEYAPGYHARSGATWLTSVPIVRTDRPSGVRNGWSVDQLIATQRDALRRLPSLEITPVPWLIPTGGDEWPSIYHGTVCWHGNTPVVGATTPVAVWNKITGGSDIARLNEVARGNRDAARRSVLDSALSDLATIQRRIGKEDELRRESYLTSVRSVEQRIGDVVDLSACGGEPDLGASMVEYLEVPDLFLDLIRVALTCDVTRVATFMLAPAGSGRIASEFGLVLDHHALSHHGGDADMQARLQVFNTWESEIVSKFAQDLAATDLGGGRRLLDDTVVYYGSGMSDGDLHSTFDCPHALIGSAGGRLNTGIHVREEGVTLANLHLTMLRAAGLNASSHGDSTGVVDALLA
jgi:hypothetical protein